MTNSIASCINHLGTFCGKKDLTALTSESLKSHYQLSKVDIVVLFGGSILAGLDVLAEAMQSDMGKHYIIVGGYGHTSKSLFEMADNFFPNATKNKHSEAELFSELLYRKYALMPDYLETKSTNCGNNITNLLALIAKENIPMNSILMIQDATMQLRMDVTLQKYISDQVVRINYPAYQATVIQKEEGLVYQDSILGMWTMERYISLLLGEIPRISDNKDGYGPRGKNYLAHLDIPIETIDAFTHLSRRYPTFIRKANSKFASS